MQLTNIRQIKAALVDQAFLGSQHFLPPISPLSKKGKRKEKKYLKRKRDPSCLEGIYQVKVLGPHKHAFSPIILDPAPDAHEETSYARCGDVRNALAIPVLPNRPLCVILLAGC